MPASAEIRIMLGCVHDEMQVTGLQGVVSAQHKLKSGCGKGVHSAAAARDIALTLCI